jgi:hypothetical protein
MSKLPVLKPREVVAILNNLGFTEIRQPARTNSIAIPTVEAQRFPFIPVEIFRPYCYVKSPGTFEMTIEEMLAHR